MTKQFGKFIAVQVTATKWNVLERNMSGGLDVLLQNASEEGALDFAKHAFLCWCKR